MKIFFFVLLLFISYNLIEAYIPLRIKGFNHALNLRRIQLNNINTGCQNHRSTLTQLHLSDKALEVLQYLNDGYQPITPYPIVVAFIFILGFSLQTIVLKILARF